MEEFILGILVGYALIGAKPFLRGLKAKRNAATFDVSGTHGNYKSNADTVYIDMNPIKRMGDSSGTHQLFTGICPICQKRVSNPQGMRMHMKTHEKKETK